MREIFKRYSIYFIFLFCFSIGSFMGFNLKSFASTSFTVNAESGESANPVYKEYVFSGDNTTRYCVYLDKINAYVSNVRVYSNKQESIDYTLYNTYNGDTSYELGSISFGSGSSGRFYTVIGSYRNVSASCPIFSDLSEVYAYLDTGAMPEIPYDETLQLDSFKVTTWAIGNLQLLFKSKFVVTWSDDRISKVQVKITSTGGSATFESSLSPFKQKFSASTYVMKKGDVVHLVATPFKANGEYGTSLYYSFVYDDDVPFSNVYRKLVNTPNNDNTLEIPYEDTSGNDVSIDLPVEYVTTNYNYKVNYNPVTYEYGDFNMYEIYYSPVVLYPENTDDETIDETQDVINNNYTTNNYYETTKNININFDVSFGDISGSDIQHGFDDFGNFANGFGGFIGKLASWVLALFPFLSPAVASFIVVTFGLIVLLAIIALVLKIASVIADLIPF